MKLLSRLAASLIVTCSAAAEDKILFNRDIRPIFNRSCTGCHGGVKNAGGLSLYQRSDGRRSASPQDSDDSGSGNRIGIDA